MLMVNGVLLNVLHYGIFQIFLLFSLFQDKFQSKRGILKLVDVHR